MAGIDGTGAQTPSPTCPIANQGPGPTVTIDQPEEGEVVTSAGDAVVQGTAAATSGAVECVIVQMTRLVDGAETEVGRRVFAVPPEDAEEYTIEWPPPLPYNDTYTVRGQAVGTRFGNRFLGPVSQPRKFRTEIPPARPANLKIATNQEKRTATLTWNKNPEPDTAEYIVRRAPAEGEFKEIGRPAEPTFTDNLDGGAAPAGTYRYRVTAVRSTAPGSSVGIESTGAAEGRVTVTGPPTATSTSTTPTTGPRSTATTARSARNRGGANRVDLRRSPGATSTIPDGLQEPEDGAFGDLDFGERQDGRTDMTITELGEPVTEDGDDRPTTLLFFAGGLLAFVVLMQLRWLKNEVDRIPLEDVPPES
jgi:hypothetical protein